MNGEPSFELEHLVVARAGEFFIRRKHPSDFRDDYAWRRDPELARYDGRAATDLTYEEFVRNVADDARFASPWHESFSVVDSDGAHVGNAMFYNVSADHERAEVGMLIADPSNWGHGSGRRVMVAFVRYLWQSHPFRTLELHTLEWNERAIRCFRGAGFAETARVLREADRFLRMEARREWWLMWDAEGRFEERVPVAAVPRT